MRANPEIARSADPAAATTSTHRGVRAVPHLVVELPPECDAKLAGYRAALEAGADPTLVAGWIAETQAERRLAEQRDKRTANRRRELGTA